MNKFLPELTALVSRIALYDDENAYKQLFEILFLPLKRFSYSLLKSNEMAEEVAGDVLITLWRKRKDLTRIENLQVYSFVSARNICLNALKKKLAQPTISLDDIHINIKFDAYNPEQILINDELKKKLEFAVQSLPPRAKLVFILIKEEGLSYKEAAAVLNISVKTVDAHLVTALRKITASIKMEFNLS